MSTADTVDLSATDEWLHDTFDWYAVAKKEFRDTIRSRLFIVLAAFYVVVFTLPPAAALYLDIGGTSPGQNAGTEVFIQLMKEPTSLLVPLISVVVGYGAITRERESGSLKLLLSLPNSRRDVVLGKIVGRGLVAMVPILIGFLFAAIAILPSALTFKPGLFVGFALLTTLLGFVFVTLAVSISAATPTNFTSMIGSVGVYMLFGFVWNLNANGLGNLLVRYAGIAESTRMNVVFFLKLLNPTQAYKTLADGLYMSPMNARLGMFGIFNRARACTDALGGTISEQQCTVGSLPVQYSDPMVLGYLVVWLLIGFLGYSAFRKADL